VQGAGCRVQGAGCRVQGAGCRGEGGDRGADAVEEPVDSEDHGQVPYELVQPCRLRISGINVKTFCCTLIQIKYDICLM